jgi:uncharacterized damage-inducible protein DinB
MQYPSGKTLLREDFLYDYFANREWLAPLSERGTEEEKVIFRHILGANKIWLDRMHGYSHTSFPHLDPTEENLRELRDGWLAVLERFDYDHDVSYRNLKGEAGSRRLGDIARHVPNHGTYHRGQLRESFGRRGAEFPETDFILYSYHRDEA